MPISVELPQCPICQDPFTKSGNGGRPVTPKGCGHVYCKQCADVHFKRFSNASLGQDAGSSCPLCRLPCSRNDLIELYLDFGRQDANVLSSFNGTSKDVIRVEDEEEDVLLTIKKLSISDRGERAIRKLGELAAQSPLEWKSTRTKSKGGNLSAFRLSGSVIRDVAKSIINQDNVKDVLQRLSVALEDLHRWHSRVIELAEDHARLRKRKEELKAELGNMKLTHERQLKDRELKLEAHSKESEGKQAELRRRLHERSEELESEQQKAEAFETVRRQLEEQVEKWRRDSSKYKKRFELKKQECDKLKSELELTKSAKGYDETSDSSLQVIDNDEGFNQPHDEDAEGLFSPPPTSSSTSLKRGRLSEEASGTTTNLPRFADAPHLRPPLIETIHPPKTSFPPVLSETELPLHSSSRSNHAVLRDVSIKLPQQERTLCGETELGPRGKNNAQRIFTMPVPSRTNVNRGRVSPKKKQRLFLELD